MKRMILVLGLLALGSDVNAQKMQGLNRSERSFVKNVINVQKEKPTQITKRLDQHIVVEFSSTMIVLKPDGYVGEVWILEDEDWLCLGREEDAY